MWSCPDCGYADDDPEAFEAELDPDSGETVRLCPECGGPADEVDDEDDLDLDYDDDGDDGWSEDDDD